MADAARCRAVTGCSSIMIGWGILRDPCLPAAIARGQQEHDVVAGWQKSLDLLRRFTRKVVSDSGDNGDCHPYYISNPQRYLDGRLKQWLSMMGKHFPQAQKLFGKVKRETTLEQLSYRIETAL